MTLSDASLTELVAELRERLRPFMTSPPGQPSPPETGQALGPSGRAALAARLLVVLLGSRQGPAAAAVAKAFGELAEALAITPAPLPGSALEDGLRRLAREFEDLALALEAGEVRGLERAWSSLREVGDRLWPLEPGRRSEPVTGRAMTPHAGPAPAPAPAAAAPAGTGSTESAPQRLAVWLLVAGGLRRETLRRRLEQAGLAVVCPADAATAVARLTRERPAAVICDDAAPARHGSRLQMLLPAAAPPVILVRGRRAGAVESRQGEWLPPFRTADLLARLGEPGSS